MPASPSHTRHLAVIVPCFNEETSVGVLVDALDEVLGALSDWTYEVYFVDDGSTDTTLARLNDLAADHEQIRVCSLSRNFGQQIALTAGLELASSFSGTRADTASAADAFLVMDADLQNPPAIIPEMLSALCSDVDVVMGVRRTRGGRSRLKRFTSDLFYWLFNRISEVPIEPSAPDFFLLSQRAHRELLRMPERSRFLRGMVAWLGFNRTYVHFDPPARAAGKSKYTVSRMVAFASDAMFAFSAAPIRLAIRIGCLVAALGVLYLGVVVGRQMLFHTNVEGWSSLMSAVLILGGLQLLMIGLIGGYVARIFEESKGRPLYVVRQYPQQPVARTRARGAARESSGRLDNLPS